MINNSRRNFLKKLGLFTTAPLFSFKSASNLKTPAKDAPNIVFLLSDDQSRPDMGCYGNPAIHTPNLDQLAAEGMRFNRAYVTASSCSPSRGSIFTGRSPHATGSSKLHVWVLPEIANLLDTLKEHGYYIGGYRKLHQDNYENRFDFFGDDDVPLSRFFEERPKEKPFFLWFGSDEPHRPYGPGRFDPPHDPAEVIVPDFLPDTPEVRQDIAWYYDQMGVFDNDCGIILDMIEKHGLTDNTMVVVGSDNGMPFARAKATVYEAGMNVPLLVKWPGKTEPGRVTDELVSYMDLMPTWLEAAGIESPDYIEGRSIVSLLKGEDYTSTDYIYGGRNWHDNWVPARTVIGKRYKLIQNYRPSVGYLPSLDIQESPSYRVITEMKERGRLSGHLTWYENTETPQQELYDLENDPGEWNNLAGDPAHAEILDELESALSEWIDNTRDFLPPPKNAYGAWNEVYRDVNPLDGWLENLPENPTGGSFHH